MRKITSEEALEYHSRGRKGKIEVVPTKPCRTQEDLSLAYTPGVAEPCLAIEKDPQVVPVWSDAGDTPAQIFGERLMHSFRQVLGRAQVIDIESFSTPDLGMAAGSCRRQLADR